MNRDQTAALHHDAELNGRMTVEGEAPPAMGAQLCGDYRLGPQESEHLGERIAIVRRHRSDDTSSKRADP
jgi:hypothetical protein